jgi:Protein of unknown function (DUF998)
MVRKIFLSCGIVSSVLYVITDVLGTLRYPGYSYADQEFSELTAQGAPTRDFMVALNVVPYTLLVAAFAGASGHRLLRNALGASQEPCCSDTRPPAW